jgi:hypothetical protein
MVRKGDKGCYTREETKGVDSLSLFLIKESGGHSLPSLSKKGGCFHSAKSLLTGVSSYGSLFKTPYYQPYFAMH